MFIYWTVDGWRPQNTRIEKTPRDGEKGVGKGSL